MLAHESCPLSGEMLAAIAGRVAKLYVAETPGVYRASWTMQQVADDLDAIRDMSDPLLFPVVPGGFGEHIGYSFTMATTAKEAS
jgi:hypothetical protein